MYTLKVYLSYLCSIGSTGSNLHTPPAGLLLTLSFNMASAAEYIEHYKIIQTLSEGEREREKEAAVECPHWVHRKQGQCPPPLTELEWEEGIS